MKECPPGIFRIGEGRVYNNNKRRPLCDIITICASMHAWMVIVYREQECSLDIKGRQLPFVFFCPLQCTVSILSFSSCSSFISPITSLNSCFTLMFCFLSSNYESIMDDNSGRRLTVIPMSGIELIHTCRIHTLEVYFCVNAHIGERINIESVANN